MIRKLLGTLTLLAVLLLAAPSWAGAAVPYPAPPVPTTLQVSPTSSALVPLTTAPAQAAPPADPLAYTGSGINVGLAVTVGGIVVLLGIALVLFGGRRAFGRSRRS